MHLQPEALHALSPLDGRYAEKTKELRSYFSEFALLRERCRVEIDYVVALDALQIFPPLTHAEHARIAKLRAEFSEADAVCIKEIEATIRHDVKSCECFVIDKLHLSQPGMVHFGLTSEDINNLAWGRLLKEYLHNKMLPQLKKVMGILADLAEAWQDQPFPARTHGQLASPTTAGKELAVFLSRLTNLYTQLKVFRFRGKCNGATGNYSAWMAAAPQVDWQTFAQKFVESQGLDWNRVTTQIEDHDHWCTFFNLVRQTNLVILDLDQDMWIYLMQGLLQQKSVQAEVGSSTMPHKVNPIHFENSEGNLQISNALLTFFSEKLPRSRLQRDLSDSTVVRNMGVAFGHNWVALEETCTGLTKLSLNRTLCSETLEAHPELLGEAIQTVLRLAGGHDPYDALKQLTRGQPLTSDFLSAQNLENLVETTKVRPENREQAKARLAELPAADKYTGAAQAICRETIAETRRMLAADDF